jgi:hypothetical protein
MFAIRELYVVLAITTFLSSAVLFRLHNSTYSTHGILHCALGMSACSIGELLIILRGYVPFYVSVIGGNGLGLLGLLLLSIGIRNFFNLSVGWRIYLFGLLNLLTASLLLYWFSVIEFNVAIRIGAFNALVLPYTIFIAHNALTSQSSYRGARALGILNILGSIVCFLRIVTSLSAPLYKSFFASGLGTAVYIIWLMLYVILMAASITMLAIEKKRSHHSHAGALIL